MSGIAEVFSNQGYPVSGSDVQESELTRRLVALGVQVHIGHRAEWVIDADCVVVSSAIQATNPEVLEAKKRRIPVIPRAEMLGELMRHKTGIAVAGSHGKTTTTSMLATVMVADNRDPTLVIGGRVDSLGGNAKLGQGQYVVAEADESDGSFLHLPATYAVITNIDNDHLDHFKNLEAIEDAFVQFASRIPFFGLAVVCIEDAGVRRCLDRLTKPFVTYGFREDSDFRAVKIKSAGWGSKFRVEYRGKELGEIQLNVPGQHNVLNALAAVALAIHLEIPFTTIVRGLNSFKGVNRRLQTRFEGKGILVLDDYGHHPTEIRATLSAVKEVKVGHRILVLFQPHRYTRTLHSGPDFVGSFKDAGKVWITDIYAAGEAPIPGVDSAQLSRSIRHPDVHYAGSLADAEETVMRELRSGDVLICMGAGSITQSATRISKRLSDV